MRKIYLDLVDTCLNRPPSAEDANSIAGERHLPSDQSGTRQHTPFLGDACMMRCGNGQL